MKRRTCAVLAVCRADAVSIELRERYECLIGTNIGCTLNDTRAYTSDIVYR